MEYKMELSILHPYVGIIQIRCRVLSQPYLVVKHPVHFIFAKIVEFGLNHII